MIAISSAFKEALIAIDVDGKKDFLTLDANCKHSENILPSIDKMLDKLNLTIKDNKEIAVVIGPGSFTGLRIGIALAKGLNQARPCQIIAITSFDLITYSYCKNYTPKNDFYCVLDALSGLVFVCKYNKKGEKIGQEQMITKEQLAQLQGDKVGIDEEGVGDIKIKLTAEELLELSIKYLKEGRVIDDEHLLPLYLRKSQAEANLDSKK